MDNDPTYGASIEFIMKVTDAPLSTARRWKANPDKMPACAAKLVRFAVFGNLAEILGPEWKDFRFQGGMLYPPYFRGGFTALHIASMFFERQELLQYRRDNSLREKNRIMYRTEIKNAPKGAQIGSKLTF